MILNDLQYLVEKSTDYVAACTTGACTVTVQHAGNEFSPLRASHSSLVPHKSVGGTG